MSNNTGLPEIPDGDDIIIVSEALFTLMEKCYDFLCTHPTPIRISTAIQNIL